MVKPLNPSRPFFLRGNQFPLLDLGNVAFLPVPHPCSNFSDVLQ
jgi:hypothetical protein